MNLSAAPREGVAAERNRTLMVGWSGASEGKDNMAGVLGIDAAWTAKEPSGGPLSSWCQVSGVARCPYRCPEGELVRPCGVLRPA